VSGTEAARAQPERENAPAHDAFTRLLHRLEPDPDTLWAEAAPLVARDGGVLVRDDRTLDKPYARQIGLLTRHWSGKHRRVVQGINLLTRLWTDGEALLPGDYRRYDKGHDGLSKNGHFRALLAVAEGRGCAPACVAFDSWYASLPTLKAVRGHGWRWVTQLQKDRRVNPDGTGNRPRGDGAIGPTGTRVHRHGDGFVLVFLIVHPDGDRDYWATSDRALTGLQRRKDAELAWGIAVDHRGFTQHAGSSVPRSAPPARSATTSPAPCAPSSASNATDWRPGCAGGRPRRPSSATRAGATSPRRYTLYRQLRNS
jgi:hypothetical protein